MENKGGLHLARAMTALASAQAYAPLNIPAKNHVNRNNLKSPIETACTPSKKHTKPATPEEMANDRYSQEGILIAETSIYSGFER
jgi:hypothetical protein